MGKLATGTLNKRVTFQSKTLSTDSWGQTLDVWTDVVTVWANVRTTNGSEFIAAGAEVSRVSKSVRIRYRTDITAAMRAVYGGENYDIIAVLPDDDGKEYVDVVVTVGANEG